MSKRIIYLSGLPRSGSTVLANVLGMHKDIHATPSSPLCTTIQSMRRSWSDDSFLLAQLDSDFDEVHQRLRSSTLAFMQAWCGGTDKPVVVDKSRGWLLCLETLRELDPDFKMVVTMRDLGDILASIERQHRKTIFIEFPDHMEHNLVDSRANLLFSEGGLIGLPLKALQNVQDIPDILKHIYYWRYEDFVANPQATTEGLFDFLGVERQAIDFDGNIVQSTRESDSHYRMKYPHKISSSVKGPSVAKETVVSPRILDEIRRRFSWYYDQFYPVAPTLSQAKDVKPASGASESPDDAAMIGKLEQLIRDETDLAGQRKT